MANDRRMVGYLSIQIIDDDGVTQTKYAPWVDREIRHCPDCQNVEWEMLSKGDAQALKCATQLAKTLDEILQALEESVRGQVNYPPLPERVHANNPGEQHG